MLITTEAVLLAGVALAGQIMATLVFARETMLTKDGTFCRVKCILATAMHGTVATLLARYFFG